MRPFRPAPLHTLGSLARRQACPRQFPLLHRRALRPNHRNASTSTRVKIRRPWLTWQRMGSWVLYCSVFTFTLNYVFNQVFDEVEIEVGEVEHRHTRDDDEEEEEEDEDEEEEGAEDSEEEGAIVVDMDDEDSDVVFFPLQIPRKLPKQYYTKSDPEWKEFTKFSRDPQKMNSVRHELADNLTAMVQQAPKLQKMLGNDIKWSRLWLDFIYPEGPPPQYERKGLLLLEDEIALSTQVIPHSYYVQLAHVMWPSAFAHAAYNGLWTLWALQWIKLKNWRRVELTERERYLQAASRMFAMRRAAQLRSNELQEMHRRIRQKDDQNGKVGSLGDTQKQEEGKHEGASWWGRQEAKVRPEADDSPSSAGESDLYLPKLPVIHDLSMSYGAFWGSLASSWRNSKVDRKPAGCCFIVGDVEVIGSRGKCKIEVRAAYNPKSGQFPWVDGSAKHMWERYQSPKGRPS